METHISGYRSKRSDPSQEQNYSEQEWLVSYLTLGASPHHVFSLIDGPLDYSHRASFWNARTLGGGVSLWLMLVCATSAT